MRNKHLFFALTPLFLIFTSPSFADRGSNYLTDEQERVLERRARIDAMERLFIDPELIMEGARRKEDSERATLEILRPPSQQRQRAYRLSMNDGSLRTINVYPNQITTVTITDTMGVAWPLSSQPMVASDTYRVSYNPDIPGFLTIETTAKFVPSSLALTIENRLRPIQFQLVSDNYSLDYAVEITIEGVSPKNGFQPQRQFEGHDIPTHDNQSIAQFLTEPPEDAVRLPVIGDQSIVVWRWGSGFVIRSPYQLISPSNPTSVQSRMDVPDSAYFVKGPLDVVSFLNERTSQFINIEVVGGLR